MLQTNAVNIHKHFFRMVFWAGMVMFLLGCGTHHPTDRETQDPLTQMVHFYQGPLDHLSAVRYGGCPMAPHCSAYALTAVEQHGPLMGIVMTFDRLIRCGNDEVHLSPEVFVNGRRRTYDPLSANEWNPQETSQKISQWEILIE